MQEYNAMRAQLSKMKELEARYEDLVERKLAVEKDLRQAKVEKKKLAASKEKELERERSSG